MLFPRWLKKRQATWPLRRSVQPRRLRTAPIVEVLEDRTLLTAPATPPLLQQSPDPGATGPLAVSRAVYQQTNSAGTPQLTIIPNPSGPLPNPVPNNYYGDPSDQTQSGQSGPYLPVFRTSTLQFPVEVLADVYYPTNLSGGPYPIVFFLHGQHNVFVPSTGQPIPNYIGYDYISQTLASYGYIVVSISADDVNFQDRLRDIGTVAGMRARAELVQHHLDIWNQINTRGGGASAPLLNQFIGEVNLQDVGLMGHSRGGEGVVTAFNYNRSLGSPYGIKAVMPLAAVDFNADQISNVPLGVVLPEADGDVRSLAGVRYFDDTFRAGGDTSPEEMFLVMGANHNYFNTVWTPSGAGTTGDPTPNDASNPNDPAHNNPFPSTAADDWRFPTDSHAGFTVPGNGRLSSIQQRAVGLDYVSAFFQTYLGNSNAYLPMLKGDALPPASVLRATVHPTYLAPDTAGSRLDVNRLDRNTNLTTNTLGGAVVTSGVTTQVVPLGTSIVQTNPHDREPDFNHLSRVQMQWNQPTAFFTNDLPAGNQNLSGFAALEFRAGLYSEDQARNPVNQAQDFSVILTDAEGDQASVKVSDWSSALYYPPGGSDSSGTPLNHDPLPKLLLDGVRIPLGAFLSADPALDLSDVTSIRFAFNLNPTGDLVFSDISLDDAISPLTYTATTGPNHFVLRADGNGNLEILDNGAVVASRAVGLVSSVSIVGANNTDNTLTINYADGTFTQPVSFNGGSGTGSHALTLGGATATADTYSPGPNPGQGTDTLVFANATERVSFSNLQPVFDMLGGPLTVKGSNAANAITYTEGSANGAGLAAGIRNPAWGEVSVDNFEPIEFTNKTSLTINGLPGADVITLNNPFTPTNLASLTVNGGAPNADTLVVDANATAGAGINFAPTSSGGGGITGTGVGGAAPGVPITFSNIGQVNINGQNEDDNLTVTTPAGGTLINLTPGAVADAGTVTLRQFIGAGGSPLVGLHFVNLGTDNALGRLGFANAGGRIDSLTVNGVANASDIFSVSSAGNINLDQPVAGGVPNGLLLNVATPGVSELQLVGLATNDTFNVAGNHPFTAGVFVDGDRGTLNFTGDGTAAVTADLGASTVTETGFGPVGYTGVGTVNVSVGGAALTIGGAAGDDNLTYTPTVGGTQGAGTVTGAGLPTTLSFNGVTGTFTLNPLGGNNTVTVNGTPNADTFSASAANGGGRLLLTPTGVAVQGGPVVNLAGVSQINFLNAVVDVSALIKLLFRSKVKHLSGHRLKIHFTLGNLSALALGGPLVLIFSGLTGRARVLGVSGSTTLPTSAGVNLPWIRINEGAVPVIRPGQQIGFDVIFRTRRSRVSFTPFFVIASRAP